MDDQDTTSRSDRPRGLLRRELAPRLFRRLGWQLPTLGVAWFTQRRGRDLRSLLAQLEAIVRTNASLPAGLLECSRDAPNHRIRRALRTLAAQTENGSSLGGAMRELPATFPPHWIDRIDAAERSGSLSGTLSALAAEANEGLARGRIARNHLAYFWGLLIVNSLLIAFVSIRIMPVYAEILQEFEHPRPFALTLILRVGQFLNHHPLGILAACFAAAPTLWILSFLHRRIGLFQSLVTYSLLPLPSVGNLYRLGRVEHVARLLETMVIGGVSLPDAIREAGRAQGLPRPYKRALSRLAIAVERGSKLSSALIAHRFLFSDEFRQLVILGEHREDLAWAFREAGENSRSRAARLKNIWVQASVPIGVAICAVGVLLAATATISVSVGVGDAIIQDI